MAILDLVMVKSLEFSPFCSSPRFSEGPCIAVNLGMLLRLAGQRASHPKLRMQKALVSVKSSNLASCSLIDIFIYIYDIFDYI